jgi:hypothetical protein
MSPLLGALGDSSEYAYRGNIDDVPVDFTLTNVTDVNPGVAVTTGPITISGINNRILVSVGSGASIAINSGIFTSGPGFATNGQTVSVLIPTTSGTDADFSKTYTTRLTLGKRVKEWSVTTREKDSTPDPFSFTNFSNQELGVIKTSNTITVSGLDSTIPSSAAIVSGIGSFRKNGGAPGTASTIGNGDTIAMVLSSPTDYSKTNSSTLTLGTYSTTFSVSSRAADTTVNQFTFTDFTNVAISSSFDSNPITLTGADNNTVDAPVPLTATVSGGFLKVERGGSTIRDFSPSSATVFNGDILTLRLNSSPNYSIKTSSVLSITGANTPVGVASTFSVTTRPIVSDTIPNQFTFIDRENQQRNVSITSNSITLSGITTHADDFATASLSNNTDGGQFRVTRNGVVVKNFSADSSQVRNGDVIDLRITTSPASQGTVLTRLNVSGIDNTDINNIITQTINDTWVVKSATRNCPLTAPSFTNVSNVDPSTLHVVTFTPTGYDSDCKVIVNTSNPNSYLKVNGVTGNDLEVPPGVLCEVYMTAGPFSEVRTTTVTLTANNNLPSPSSTTSNWSVTTRSAISPTATLTSDPSFIDCGENTTLTWRTTNATSVTSEGFSIGVSTSGSLEVGPLKKNTTYSITATGPDGISRSSSTTVSVTSPATATISANSTSIAYNESATLTWSSSNASSVVSNFGVTATSGSITLNNLTQSKTYTVYAKSDNACGDSPTVQVTVNVAACAPTKDTYSPTTGVTLNYTYADAGSGYTYYYSGLTGSGIFNASRVGKNETKTETFDGASVGSDTFLSWTVPDGVTSIYGDCRGGGGGGGGGGPVRKGGGGGGGGYAYGSFSVTPGENLTLIYGPGKSGAPCCDAGNTNIYGAAAYGTNGSGAIIQRNGSDILRARGGYGGGRDIGGVGGGGTPTNSHQTNRGDNVNNTGNGGTAIGSSGSVTSGGSSYGTGGNGGGLNTAGSSGSASVVKLTYTINIEGVNWNTLISGINSQYKSSFNRPATSDEMDYWISVYTDYSYDTIAEIKSAIASSGATRSSSGAKDECGNTIQ